MKTFTIRTQGSKPSKTTYASVEEAYEVAKAAAQETGKDTAVIEHEGDNSRLVRKVFHISR